MKHILSLLLLTILFGAARAHDGDDHDVKKAAASAGARYFSSEALSDKYEVLLKWGELRAGTAGTWQLFLSEANSNRAIDAASLSVKVAGKPNVAITATRTDTGIYRLSGTFPANGSYDLQVSIGAAPGPDLLQVSRFEVGKKLAVAEEGEEHHHWYEEPWLWAAGGLLAGLLLMWALMRRRNRRGTTAVLLVFLLAPTAAMNPSAAHGGDDHGGGKAGGGALSGAFVVEKEAQFLFDIGTQKVGPGSFYQAAELRGTVAAAPQGRAVIQTPQTGTIRALRVAPGQDVRRGQVLAVVEQQVEAGTQLDIIAQRNTLNAEVKAARAQYERLQSIADIAAKKDVTEARARYEAAQQNLQLFNANLGRNLGSTRMIQLTAPISGVVGTFNYAIGAVVNSGETLFEITNLEQVFVETQLYAGSEAATRSGRFVAFSGQDTTAYALRLVSTAQSVNPGNQAQRAVFEVLRPAGRFRIGENVRVLHYGADRIAQLVVPAAAVTDIGGRPAVFIKDRAEGYSVSFVQKGESNPLYTAIVRGVEAGERVVTENVYQMKMIYLGQ
ncbi:efflux RND transporter periplasmic adaptor subunit [Flaviaesturariibacter amylovorans]|uniref:Efflux RND transporter periplasmic adaptor subunit n=1 Tax=Flaviaesturariibacter amylovorans TaxID=1084520 RepID=A0ABP8GD16_9BACT